LFELSGYRQHVPGPASSSERTDRPTGRWVSGVGRAVLGWRLTYRKLHPLLLLRLMLHAAGASGV